MKVALGTATFGWVGPFNPLVQSDCRIGYHQFLWKESIDILVFCMQLFTKGKQHLNYHFWLGVSSYVSCSIRLSCSLISQITGQNQWMSLIFFMELIIKGRQHLRLAGVILGQKCFQLLHAAVNDLFFSKICFIKSANML